MTAATMQRSKEVAGRRLFARMAAVVPPCQHNPDEWFAAAAADRWFAAAECRRCPLTDLCRAYALTEPAEKFGVWGGLDLDGGC